MSVDELKIKVQTVNVRKFSFKRAGWAEYQEIAINGQPETQLMEGEFLQFHESYSEWSVSIHLFVTQRDHLLTWTL